MKMEENFAEKGEHAGYKHFLLSNKVLNGLHNLSDCEHPMIYWYLIIYRSRIRYQKIIGISSPCDHNQKLFGKVFTQYRAKPR